MKQFLKVSLLAILLVVSGNTFAQQLKFGHVDSSNILSIMPEKAIAEKQVQAKALEFDKQIKEMQAENQRLITAYMEVRESMSEALRTNKEKEIQDLQNRMQSFDGFAQQELQKAQNELLKPIFEKASKAIKDVGQENGFIYIFDISSGVLLFNSNESVDITPLVKAKLGIQ